MKLLFVADGRSPIANNWIKYFLNRGDEVHLASTFDCEPDSNLASLTFVPVAYSQFKKRPSQIEASPAKNSFLWSSSFVDLRTSVRRFLAPLTVLSAADQLKTVINSIQPDLVHAMRIPFEGILAAKAMGEIPGIPLLISVWGNDFTLHAEKTPWMKNYTHQTLARADGLHTDCQRDLNLATRWGYPHHLPSIVLPGNGGVQVDIFYPVENQQEQITDTVINPRGIRSYIRNDTFFKAIPSVLKHDPGIKFVCPGMGGESLANRWVEELQIHQSVELLPKLSQVEMAEAFRRAKIAVSPSTHDGTPNTLLEAMACGCFPVAGDLESLREWIDPEVNGLLFDPADPSALAQAIIKALDQPELIRKAMKHNQGVISERAEYQASMKKAIDFYQSLIR